MMFTLDTNLEDPKIYEKFDFDAAKHVATWEHYYHNYNQAFAFAIQQGLEGSYGFNAAAHGLMFLLRHVVELNLKYNLSLKGVVIPNSHVISDLLQVFPDQAIIPAEFLSAIKVFENDADGSRWRYYSGNDDVAYFGKGDKIKLAETIKLLNAVPSTPDFVFSPVSAPFEYDKKTIDWSLTLHIGQCDSEWHVKGEFDILTILMIRAIESGNAQVKDLYLALLYNIRHGIELALKGNVWAIQPVSVDISQKNIDGQHSLAGVYNVLKGYLEKVDWTKVEPKTNEQYASFKAAFEKLNDAIHQLDSHSRAFRFPFDKNGVAHRMNLGKTEVRELIKLYKEIDPFLLFTTNVLIENNLLSFDPEIHG